MRHLTNICWIIFAAGLLVVQSCGDDEQESVSDSDNKNNDTESDTGESTDGDTTQTADAGETADAGDPSESWVNILDVSTSGSDGSYFFTVTFESADVDCTRYADWWEVLSEDGTLLYRRILMHPHTKKLSGNPVARSGGPVSISAMETVIVRGHMNDVGYSGTPMRGSIEGGFVAFPKIAPSFAINVETEEPQPGECIAEEDVM